MKISPRIIAPFLFFLYKLWCKTLRYTVTGRDAVDALAKAGTPMVFPMWHDEIFTIIHQKKSLKIVTIVSQSKDGEYLAQLLQALGLKTARGSSSRGAISALLQAAKIMKNEGYNGCVTVDGPRGPRHKVKDGALFLAHRSSGYIVPVRMFASRVFRFNSWDKFQLPLPFSRVYMEFGTPYHLESSELATKDLTHERARLEEKLENMAPPDDFFSHKKNWKFQILSFLAQKLQTCSLKNLHTAARFFAACFWYFFPNRRNLAIEAIQKHLEVDYLKAVCIAKESFTENFKSFFEIFYAKQLSATPKLMTITDYSPGLKSFIGEKGPIVVATAHLGSWELMEPYAAMLQPDKKRIVVVRGQRNVILREIMRDLRSSGGVEAVEHRNAAKIAMKCLRGNGLAGFLVDHNSSKKEAIFLPFLNELAAVNQGPALLALRSKATVYPSFLLRTKDGKYSVYIDTPLRTSDLTGTVEERVEQIARYYTRSVEKMVQKHPEQWFWMHKRWKTRP